MKLYNSTIFKSIFISIILALIASVSYAGKNQEAESTVSHFTTVWQGENGQNHMNFIVVSAFLDQLSLSADDEIAVFCGLNCVGFTKLTKAINPTDITSFLSISASQDDGANNGFVENEPIILKIWDNKNQKELVATTVTFRKDMPEWLTTGKFSAGATSVVEISCIVNINQPFQFIKGTNLFSTYLIPANPDVSVVMKSLCDKGYLISMQDEVGNTLTYSTKSRVWINNIGSIQKTEGYLINLTTGCTFQISGKMINLPLDIPLKAGWNFISFPRIDAVDGMKVVQSLIDQNKLVKVQDELGNTIENLRRYGGWKNSIGNFSPGKAYKINVSSVATLTIQ